MRGRLEAPVALCHADEDMPVNFPNPERSWPPVALLLGIDTCGPSGSVALGRMSEGAVEILGQIELEGRSYSATLVAAVGELLALHGVGLRELGAIVAVNGPGSFTGVRVGLSAVKGLAEPAGLPVAAVSRLAVLAAKAGVGSAALDAHRHEVFLLVGEARELLAGDQELAAVVPPPERVAVCDEAAAVLLAAAWPGVELVRMAAPTAADALRLAASRVAAGEFVNVALLDGHYLRRSDAEIFGDPVAAATGRL
jgi:tRNA threonylcarbamoyladenosine biosynthesis protein TsaB